MEPYCDLDYFLTRARSYSDNPQDDEMIAAVNDGLLIGASQRLDVECGWDFGYRTVTNRVYRSGQKGVAIDNDGYLYVNTNSPVVLTITAMQYRTNPQDATSGWQSVASNLWTATPGRTDPDGTPVFWDTDSNTIMLYSDWGCYRNSPIEVMASYTGGFTTIPGFLVEMTFQMAYFYYNYTRAAGTVVTNMFNGMQSIPKVYMPDALQKMMEAWAKPGWH